VSGGDLEPGVLRQIAEAALAQHRREKRIAGLGRGLVAAYLLFLLLPPVILVKERFKYKRHSRPGHVGLRCANPTYGCAGCF